MSLVINQEEDHFKWSKQREYVLSLETINENTSESAVDSVNFLEQELGRIFLKNFSVNHPLRQKISKKRQIKELIELTDTLKTLKYIR